MEKLIKSKKIFAIIFGFSFLVGVIFYIEKVNYSYANKINGFDLSFDIGSNDDVLYLSDIPYKKAEIGWGTIGIDKTNSNGALTMLIDGAVVTVKKGIWAHATSTVEYDISSYKDYAYFTTYYGLNTTNNNVGNGVKFYVYTSSDGENWTLKTDENPAAVKSGNNAVLVKVDIRDANYIRLYANDNGSNASDHAVWADAKLVKEGYNNNVMPSVSEYDKIIEANYQPGAVSDDLKLTLLQREFIKNIGQYQLRLFLDKDSKNSEMLDWFLNNEEALRLWTMGGKPSGTYERSLDVLSALYHEYKDDLTNEGTTELGTKYKDLYLKMMLSLSLSHAANVGLWVGGNQLSDAVVRYDIYKQMHLNNQLDSNYMFENYTIDEMRAVMFTNIDDEEIMWLHDYSLKKFPDKNKRFYVQNNYITYRTGYGYYKPQYYSAENYDKWNAKYSLSDYNITYQAGKPKLWIVFEEGSVCGGISKTASNLYGVWGYPARVVGQPAHAAYIYLYNAGGGKNAWKLSYNVASTAWANTGGSATNGWGTKYVNSGNGIQSGSYILLNQEAQNEYEKYEKAELILLQAGVFKNDKKKLEQIYRDALNEEIINLDAWIGLTDVYLTDNTKSDEDLYNLAKEVAEVYTYHPLPMYDSTKRIATKLKSSPAFYAKLMTLQGETLKKATKATSANTIYTKEVPVIANALLGITDSRIATFSFDGADAGKIVLSKQLQSAQTNWAYSLDGGTKWIDCDESSVQLTKEELENVTPENDIKVYIYGLPKTESNIYTIDIKQGSFPASSVTIDDFENRFNGVNNKMEWTLDPTNGDWQAFSDATPLFKGDVVVYVRMIATGVYTTTNPVHYTFTTNASSLTNRFIPRNKISVKAAAPHGKYSFSNMVDGNINTAWFSKESSFGQGFQKANVILELDEPRYVSELDYIPFANAKTEYGGYATGKAKAIEVQVSDDYTNWITVASVKNLANDSSAKKITFDEPRLVKYVSIKFTEINAPALTSFVSVAVLNLYENPTVSEIPLAEVSYDILKKTNKDVVAELVNENREITVTNNGGKKTHTFTENGEFTFEFIDKNGKVGSATAIVDWIDKTPPKLDVSFSTTKVTNEDVVATLAFDKENVTIISNIDLSENPIDGSKTLTFSKNGSIDLEFQDELGNIGTKTITVDWIDTEVPTAEFEFSTTYITDKEVAVTLKPNEEVTILNNNGNDTYTFKENGEFTFEFVDLAGNIGEATAKVNWIAPIPQYTIKYSTNELTKDDVKVILEFEENYQIFNNNASNEYVFTKNGNFEFQYKDKHGNIGVIPVAVDWIDKDVPTAEFEFSIDSLTNGDVVVTLKPSEEITILNNDGKDTYTFIKNGKFTFEFVDKVGNKGSATAKVDWIDKEHPSAKIEYSTKEVTSGVVVAKLIPSEEVTILNNDGKDTYTFKENAEYIFEFVDKAGNKGYAVASVDWIDKKIDEKDPDDNKEPVKKPGDNNSNNSQNNNNQSNNVPDKNIDNEINTDDKNKPNDSTNKSESSYVDIKNEKANIKIAESIMSNYKDASLDYKSVPLTESQKYRFGDDCEVYEFSLKTSDDKTVPLVNEDVELTLNLDTKKKFDGVYVIRDDGSIVKLDYKVNNDKVIFKDKGLGKYIVSYNSDNKHTVDDNIKDTVEKVKDKSNYVIIVIGGISALAVSGIGYFVLKRKNKEI